MYIYVYKKKYVRGYVSGRVSRTGWGRSEWISLRSFSSPKPPPPPSSTSTSPKTYIRYIRLFIRLSRAHTVIMYWTNTRATRTSDGRAIVLSERSHEHAHTHTHTHTHIQESRFGTGTTRSLCADGLFCIVSCYA